MRQNNVGNIIKKYIYIFRAHMAWFVFKKKKRNNHSDYKNALIM